MPAAIPSLSYHHHHMDGFVLLNLQQQRPNNWLSFSAFLYLPLSPTSLLTTYLPDSPGRLLTYLTHLTYQTHVLPSHLIFPCHQPREPPRTDRQSHWAQTLPKITFHSTTTEQFWPTFNPNNAHNTAVLTELTVQTKQTITGSTNSQTMQTMQTIQTIQTMQTIEIIKTTQTTTHTDFKSLSLPSLIGQLRNSCDVLE